MCHAAEHGERSACFSPHSCHSLLPLSSQPSIHCAFSGHSPVSSGHLGVHSLPLAPAVLGVLHLLCESVSTQSIHIFHGRSPDRLGRDLFKAVQQVWWIWDLNPGPSVQSMSVIAAPGMHLTPHSPQYTGPWHACLTLPQRRTPLGPTEMSSATFPGLLQTSGPPPWCGDQRAPQVSAQCLVHSCP